MRRQNFNKPHRISHIFSSARGPNRRLFQSLNKKPPCYLRAPYLFSFFLGVAPSNPKHCKWPLDMAILAGGKVCWQREDGDLLHTLWSEGGIGWRFSCLEYKRLGGRKIILVPTFIISHPKNDSCKFLIGLTLTARVTTVAVGNEKRFVVCVINVFWIKPSVPVELNYW